MNTEEMIRYDRMVEMGIATAEEINLIKNIKGGSWNEVLNLICEIRTGYRTFEQFIENEMEKGE